MADFNFSGAGGKLTAVQLPWTPSIRDNASFGIEGIADEWLKVKFNTKVNAGDYYILLVDIECAPASIGASAVETSFIVSMIYDDEDGYPNENAQTFTVSRGAGQTIAKPEWEFPSTGGAEKYLLDFTPKFVSDSDVFTVTKNNGAWFDVVLTKQIDSDSGNWLVYATVIADAGTPMGDEITGTFTVSCRNSFGTFTSPAYTVTRQEGKGLEILPIWLDEWVSVGIDGDYMDYRIECEGKVIYQGRVYKAPNEDYILFKLNKICASYIENSDLLFINGTQQETESWSKQFDVFNTTGGVKTLIKSVVFYNDYSYTYDRVIGGNMTLNDPINNRLPYGAWIPFSFFNADQLPNSTVTIYDAGGSTNNIQVTTNNQYNVCKVMENNWYECLGVRYELSKDCADYVLYYANAFGGWDALAFYGKCSKNVEYQRYSYDKSFSNRLMTNYETNSYKTVFKTFYDLNTGWLMDRQSDKIEHLIGSNRVYLHDMKSGEIKAVVVENADVQVQKFFLNRKANNYTITVRESQERIRQ